MRTLPLNLAEKSQKPSCDRRIRLLIDVPARRIVIRPGKPMMAGALYQQGFRLRALVAQRVKKSLRLVVMNDSVLVAVNDEIFRPQLACQPLQSMQRQPLSARKGPQLYE